MGLAMNVIAEALTDVERRRKEERRQQIIAEIEEHIAEYLKGGQDRREWDVELGKEIGLSAVVIEEQWDWIYEQRLKERAGGKPKDEPPPEEPKKAAGWKRHL